MRLMLLIGMGSNSLQQLLIYFYSKIHSGFYTHNFIRNRENGVGEREEVATLLDEVLAGPAVHRPQQPCHGSARFFRIRKLTLRAISML